MTKKELKALTGIATGTFIAIENRKDLDQHWSDEEDFFEVSINEVRAALEAAYELGRKSR